jgi:hypothetical protein
MASPDQADTPPVRPLDAERARLRAAGLTDDEISRIFVARELGAQPQQAGAPAGTAGQGVMSGVLNNFNAVLAHVRGVIPAIAQQIVTLRDSSASASARITAGLSLTVKIALILVLGYAVWQEWRQHIVYQPQIAREQLELTAEQKRLTEIERRAKGHRPGAELLGPDEYPTTGCTPPTWYLKLARDAIKDGKPIPDPPRCGP